MADNLLRAWVTCNTICCQHCHGSVLVLCINTLMCVCVCVCHPVVSISLFKTPWIVAHHAPLSIEFSSQEYWGEKPFPSPVDLPHPGIELTVPCITRRFFTIRATREVQIHVNEHLFIYLAVTWGPGWNLCPLQWEHWTTREIHKDHLIQSIF